jgi:hypothetical protein
MKVRFQGICRYRVPVVIKPWEFVGTALHLTQCVPKVIYTSVKTVALEPIQIMEQNANPEEHRMVYVPLEALQAARGVPQSALMP